MGLDNTVVQHMLCRWVHCFWLLNYCCSDRLIYTGFQCALFWRDWFAVLLLFWRRWLRFWQSQLPVGAAF
jgi:hypothetical protein